MIKLFTLLLIGVTTLGISLWYFSKAKNIELINNSGCLSSENLSEKFNLKNFSLLLINSQQLAQKVKTDFPCAEGLKIDKIYPRTIKITLPEIKIVAKIPDSQLAINNEGRVVNQISGKTNIPTVDFPRIKELQAGQLAEEPGALFVVNLAKALAKTDYAVQSIRLIDPNTAAAYARQDLVVLFTKNKDLDLQVNSLQQVLARAKIDESKISKIDLRFDKPVIENK